MLAQMMRRNLHNQIAITLSNNVYSYVKQDVLLINANVLGTGAILDSSINNIEVSKSGTVEQGTFSPFGDKWAVSFNGTNDCITIAPSEATNMGSNSFTMEYWFYRNRSDIQETLLNSWTTNYYQYITAQNTINWIAKGWSGSISHAAGALLGVTPIIKNTWNHVAFTFDGTTCRMFLNGKLEDSLVQVPNTNASNITVFGINCSDMVSQPFNGNASNLRIVKGIAIYTSDFVVPTSPLNQIGNTSVLTFNTGLLKDQSPNNLQITATGTPKVTRYSPFNVTSSYDPAVIGGSLYFDGSSSLTIPQSSGVTLGASNFTLEGWFNIPSAPTHSNLLSLNGNSDLSSYAGVLMDILGTKIRLLVSSDGASWVNTSTMYSTSDICVGSWNHFALVRNNTTISFYLNGVLQLNFQAPTSIYAGSLNYIGRLPYSSPFYFIGHVSNFRLVKGTSIYTSNFMPPSLPLTAVANTQLLLSGTNSLVQDQTGNSDIIIAGNPVVSTTVYKTGNGSIKFNGVSDYLSIPDSTMKLDANDFTVETWFNSLSATGPAQQIIFALGTNPNSSSMGALSIGIYQNRVYCATGFDGGSWTSNGLLNIGPVLTDNTWYHIAVSRNSNTFRVFLNGVLIGSYTNSNPLYAGSVHRIGATYYYVGNLYFNGYLDDIRITNGVARYLEAFTPPTQSLPEHI